MKQVKELRRNIRQYLEDKSQLDFDTRISHLLPQRNKNIAQVFLFSEIRKNDKYIVSKPYATIDVDVFDGMVLNYQELVDDAKPLEWIEYTPVSCDNVRENVCEIFDISDCIMEIVFKSKKGLAENLKNKLNRLKELFNSTIPKEMMPVYYTFGKDFFDWLEE